MTPADIRDVECFDPEPPPTPEPPSVNVEKLWLVSEAGLPIFLGTTYDEHVREWRFVDRRVQREKWVLAALAASMDRSWGGSPGLDTARQQTRIQRFCQDVGIGRNDFQRLSHTYKAFERTCTTGGTSYDLDLPFKTYEVAGRLAKEDPIAAVNEAVANKWSANELQRQLEARREKRPFSLPEAIAKLREAIASWPEDARAAAPDALRDLADDVDARILPPLTVRERHAIRWIKADLVDFPFVRHTFNPAGPGRGGDLEVTPGCAGAPIYQAIVGDVSRASRSQVLHAIDNLLARRLTPLGNLVLGVARDLAANSREVRDLMILPPEAGGDVGETAFWARGTIFEEPEEEVPDFVRDQTPDYSDLTDLHEEEAVLA